MADSFAQVASRLLLTAPARTIRDQLIAQQATIVNRLWPSASFTAFGSFPQHTALRNSDLDLVISLSPSSPPPTTTAWAHRLKRNNIDAGICTRAAIVGGNTRVPLLTYQVLAHPEIHVDISFQRLSEVTARSDYIVGLLQRGAVRPTLVLLKSWLAARGFAVTRTGGIGTYGLTLSLAAAMARGGTPAEAESPYELLLRYLRFYTDPEMAAFSGILNVNRGVVDHPGPVSPTVLLRDPVQRVHVVGIKAWRMMQCREKMRELLEALQAAGPGIEEEEIIKLFADGDVEGCGIQRDEFLTQDETAEHRRKQEEEKKRPGGAPSIEVESPAQAEESAPEAGESAPEAEDTAQEIEDPTTKEK